MTASFTTTDLVGGRTLVEGTDINGVTGKTVLNNTQYNELKGNSAHAVAHEAFDKAVEKFYAPLTKAAEALEAANVATEDIFVEKISDAVEAVAARPAQYVRLTANTIILRRIEAGDTDGLVWVGDTLEIVAA
jgi:hypothetical protein